MDLLPRTLVLFDAQDTPQVRRWAHHPQMQATREAAARRALARELQADHQLERNIARLERKRAHFARLAAEHDATMAPWERKLGEWLVPVFELVAWFHDRFSKKGRRARARARSSRR